MEPKLVDALKNAAASPSAADHLYKHLNRTDINVHKEIELFQDSILNSLNNNYKDLNWKKEHKVPGQIVKDSIDIIGEKRGQRTCIIEIDTLRHDQLSPKFVSRLALCGLEKPIDYVAILYKSTQKSGRSNSEKYVRYMYDIIKKINKDSSLIAIYVDSIGPLSAKAEIWDCEQMKFSVNGTICNNMNAAAREAVSQYLKLNRRTTYQELTKLFQGKSCYVNNVEGPSRYRKIDIQTSDNILVYVYSQFRVRGCITNWYDFMDICKKNRVKIEIVW